MPHSLIMSFLSRYFPQPHARSDYLLGLLLLTYPVLLFAIRGGMNGSLFLMAAIALALFVIHRKERLYAFDRSAMLFTAATGSGMLVVLASQLYHHDVSARYFDSNARFLLAAPVLVALRQLDMRTLALLQYAFPLGAITALVMVLATATSIEYNASTSFINHIHLGDMALMLGALSALSINGFQRDTVAVKLLKAAGLLAGVTVSVLSSARGGWIAVPAIVAVAIYAQNREGFFRRMALALALICAAGLLAYAFVPPVHNRLWMIYSDLANFSAGNADTSIGIRIQLWRAAIHLFGEHPLLGVGADGFGRAMDGLAASGFLTPLAASYGKAEVHSELLAQAVRFGILGLGFILALYFVPFYLFARALGTADRAKGVAATMGMSLTLGFFIFGLTVETFDLKMTAAFYSLTVAALLAAATCRRVDPGMPAGAAQV
jgi:O-antigen ligase